MSDHKVFCAKLKQELPGLPEPPFDSELGKKIYDNVSQQAWGQWMEHCKMLLNEYRLNPARKQDQEVIVKQMEQFFFGEGAARPGRIRSSGALSDVTNRTKKRRRSKRPALPPDSALFSAQVTDRLPPCRQSFPNSSPRNTSRSQWSCGAAGL
jgi:Fe-S cluster biosynthesis and repair protein YggX